MVKSGDGFKGSRAAKPALLTILLAVSVSMLLLSSIPQEFDAQEGLCAYALQDEPPVAEAGPDQINITSGDYVELNGSGSTGFEGPEALNYTWRMRYQSANTTYYGMVVTIRLNLSGSAESSMANITLIVRDSMNRTGEDQMRIFVNQPPPSFLDEWLWTIVLLAVLGGIGGALLYTVGKRLYRGEPIVSEAGREKARLSSGRYMKIFRDVMRSYMGFVGVVILIFFALMAAFGPMVAPYTMELKDMDTRYMLPTDIHWMGTDNFGADIFSELLIGARTSMIVGIVSAVIASFLGALVGLYSGYAGGWKDEVVMRLNDIVLSIPWLVLMIIVAAFVGKIDLVGIILIIGLTGWSYTARMVRAQVLSVKERQYIERARAIGSSEMDIIRRHIFPNTFPLIFANTILTVAVSILSESTLSFLHMRPIGEVTWGTMLSYAEDASAFERGLALWIVIPGVCIVAVVLGFTLLGYALDEILNPKLRHR